MGHDEELGRGGRRLGRAGLAHRRGIVWAAGWAKVERGKRRVPFLFLFPFLLFYFEFKLKCILPFSKGAS
jgi:hypothetical protein